MLLINVLRELHQPIGSINEYELDEARFTVEEDNILNVRGTLRLLRTDRGLLATVRASGQMFATCSRCLKDCRTEFKVNFKEEYIPVTDAETGSPFPLEEGEDEAFRIDKRFDLDLREGLRQYILMSEPAKPLCQPACAGLCPDCGEDLNLGPHQHEKLDERWSALAGLKNEIEEGN